MATSVARLVKPVASQNAHEAKRSVLAVYREFQKMVPQFWYDYELIDIPLPVFREVIKNEFVKNAHITDLRIIDRKVEETRQHMVSIRYAFYNSYHVRNVLFHENVEPKAKDFLSKFLQGKE